MNSTDVLEKLSHMSGMLKYSMDKELLVLRYIDRLSIVKIAQVMHVDKAVIRRRLTTVLNYLEFMTSDGKEGHARYCTFYEKTPQFKHGRKWI